jgi:hypothetical protein
MPKFRLTIQQTDQYDPQTGLPTKWQTRDSFVYEAQDHDVSFPGVALPPNQKGHWVRIVVHPEPERPTDVLMPI